MAPALGGATPSTGPSGDNLVTLDGNARSVQTTAPAQSLGSVHLQGSPVLTVSGADIIDGAGRDHGTGTLTAQGPDVVVTGLGLTLAGTLRIQAASATVDGATIGISPSTSITASRVSFQAPAAPAPSPGAPALTAPAAVTLPGPVTIGAAGPAVVAGSGLRWVDVPTDLAFTTPEGDFSWAGSPGAGSIATFQGPIQAAYLGVRAQDLTATLHRGGGVVSLHGTGLALQAYADGVPQIRVAARIDVVSTHATTGSLLGLKNAFVWTPRNLSSVTDMAILSVHPGNAAAGNVHLSLLPMPAMFGGEPHARVGADTSGLRSGDRIDSLIARNGDDRRTIGYDGDPGTPIVLIVQGNFDPITVSLVTS